MDRWAAIGRLGGLSWESSQELVGSLDNPSLEARGTSATYGLGLEYDVHRPLHTVLRAEWEQFTVDEDDLSVNSFTATVSYHF